MTDDTRDRDPAGPAPHASGQDLSRRAFIKSSGMGTVAFAMGPGAYAAGQAGPDEGSETRLEAGKTVPITLDINGRSERLLVEPRWSLLFVLRERLGLTAAKIGCERGECGSCTVLVDDVPRYACMTLAVEAVGRHIETAEGLMDGETLGQVQASFVKEDGLQCGYCTPGQVMAAEGLLRRNPAPGREEIRHAMSGNLCRCGAYAHIFNAVEDAAKHRKG